MLIVVCGETDGDPLKSSARQIKQATTLIKSAVYLAYRSLRIILASDNIDNFNAIAESLSAFPTHLKNKFLLEFKPTTYSSETMQFKNMFRPCSSQRIFIDLLLTGEDAVIYLDTDVIFMRPPDALWDVFSRFNSTQLMAAAMPVFINRWHGADINIYKYKTRGVNAGVLLFNITRLKNLPGGLSGSIMARLEESKQPKNDQDMINYFAMQHLDLFYELDCEWNFRTYFCTMPHTCPGARTNGAYAVHGLGGTFYANRVMMLKDLFETWSNFNVSRPLEDLVTVLEDTLSKSRSHACSAAHGVDKILLHHLYEKLQRDTSLQ